MLPYFLAMRPGMGLFSVLLCLSAFQLQGRNILNGRRSYELIIVAVISFLACSGTMLYNDYQDRYRDAKKGKLLALQHETDFFRLTKGVLISVGLLACLLQPVSWAWFGVTVLMICIAIYYVRSYRYPCLSAVVVAFTAATPAFYAVLKDVSRPTDGFTLILLTMSIIFGREVLKDTEDIEADRDYKQTLPVVCGSSFARKIAASVMVAGASISMLLASDWRLLLMSGVLALCSSALWCESCSPKVGKRLIDGTIITLFVLLILTGGTGPNIR